MYWRGRAFLKRPDPAKALTVARIGCPHRGEAVNEAYRAASPAGPAGQVSEARYTGRTAVQHGRGGGYSRHGFKSSTKRRPFLVYRSRLVGIMMTRARRIILQILRFPNAGWSRWIPHISQNTQEPPVACSHRSSWSPPFRCAP